MPSTELDLPTVIPLGREDVDTIREFADCQWEAVQRTEQTTKQLNAGYYPMSWDGCLIGQAGEWAFAKWLRWLPIGFDEPALTDVFAPWDAWTIEDPQHQFGFEVKTRRERHWSAYGWRVNVSTVESRAALEGASWTGIVVHTTLAGSVENPKAVTLRGWTYVSDLIGADRNRSTSASHSQLDCVPAEQHRHRMPALQRLLTDDIPWRVL